MTLRNSGRRARGPFVVALLGAGAAAACGFSGSASYDPSDAGDADDAHRESALPSLDGSSPDGGGPSDGGGGTEDTGDAAGATDALDDVADSGVLRCGDAGVATCAGCAAGIYACRATGACVQDCKASCGSAPIACVGCEADAAATAVGVCEPASTPAACVAPPFGRCPCGGPTDCPGDRQACAGSSCVACGELNTDGLVCAGPPLNKHCKFGSGMPADQLTCK